MKRFDAVTAWLAGLPVWKFVGVLFLVGTVVPVGISVLFPETWSEDDPLLTLNAFEIAYVCFVAPIVETFVYQFLIVWLINRWVTKRGVLPIVVSALLFGASHYYSISYVLYAAVTGVFLAWGFCAYYYRYGFQRAFWSVTLVHAMRNLLACVVFYLETKI